MNFNEYYSKQAEGEWKATKLNQRGSGLGGIFRKFFRWIVPLIQQHALPMLQDGANAVSEEVIQSTSDIAQDTVQNVVSSAKRRYGTAVENLKARAENALRGNGIKGSTPMKNLIILKKRKGVKKRSLDIFD